jgi:DNA-binding transcriptional ArsR family regulator
MENIYIGRFQFDNWQIKFVKQLFEEDYDEMSEDKELKDEMKKLKEELETMKQELREMTDRLEQKRHGIYIDVNEKLSDYLGDVMEGVAEGIRGELDKSVFISPHRQEIKIARGRREETEETEKADPAKAAAIMSALGQEHRLKILSELMSGGKYISELQSTLPEITASTLSSHLDILQDAGLVVQERVRGRYLITIPGRMAYKMANLITKQRDKQQEE